MTVYVDDYRVPASVGRLSGRWSHLFAGPDDDIAELHAFAERIGLRRSWFQAKGWPRDHYDVTESKRQEAIRAGAVPVTWREGGEMRAAAIERRRAAPPSPHELWERAGGDAVEYHRLMRVHGHLLAPGDEGYEDAPGNLPCGWSPRDPAS